MYIDESRPAYRILTPAPKGFFGPDDNLYMDGECIYYDGEPNEEMEPLNALAHVKMQEFLQKLDDEGKKVAEKLGRSYVGRARTFEGALEMASAVQRAELAVMGVRKDSTIIRIDSEPVPETGSINSKRGPGRPPKAKGSLAIDKNTVPTPSNIKSVA